MFVELIDLLRCPRPHEDSWLVATAHVSAARHIVDGTMGCPVCAAEYVVHDGLVDFGESPDAGIPGPPLPEGDEEMAERLGALLDLGSAGGTVLLGGTLGGAADRVARQVADSADVRVLRLDPVTLVPPTTELVSAIRGGGAIPIAAASLRAVALDQHTADAPRLAAAVRALRPAGRLVAPAAASLPAGVTELARDAWQWVAERDAAAIVTAPIPLVRRR
jgi:hypothetical protein